MVLCVICKSECRFIFNKFDWGKEFQFFCCSSCSHCFVWPLPTEHELNDFYNVEYYVSEFQKEKVFKKASFCLNYVQTSKLPMLEVGSSYGYFLDWMLSKNIKVDGVELSAKACSVAREKGHFVFNGLLEALPTTKKYQTVFMFDVLEHISDLHTFLPQLNNVLEKDGQFIFTVPNQNALEFRWFGKYWEWVSPPAHLHYFNSKSIHALAEVYGFQVQVITSFRGDSAGNLFFHFIDSFKRRLLFFLGTLRYGREKFLEKKKEYNLKKKNERQVAKTEFSGIMRVVQIFTNFLNPLENLFRTKLNQATLFVKVTKK